MRIFKAIFSLDFVVMVALLAWLIFQLASAANMPPEYWMKQIVENTLFAVLYFANMFLFYPKLSNKFWGLPCLLTICVTIWLLVLVNRLFSTLIHADAAFVKRFSTPGHPYRPNNHWTTTWIIGVSVIIFALSYVSMVAKRLQEKLPVSMFLRLHRSFIVATGTIKSATKTSVQVGSTTIAVSE